MHRFRILFATDFHGSEACFRKFLNSARLFGANALVVGGDLTGKVLVPILRESTGYSVCFGSETMFVETDAALQQVKRQLGYSGQYFAVLEPDEAARATQDEEYRQQLLRDAAVAQVTRWAEEAARTLLPLGIELFIMAGNDDQPEICDALNASHFVVNHDEQVVFIRGVVPLIGLGPSNLTPFQSPRELPESEIACRLNRLFKQVSDPRAVILNSHCPPFGSGLDFAPEIGANKDMVSYGGQPRMIPVGSTAVLDVIRHYQPLVGLHGHCHDSKHRCRIGSTICLNPGSTYGDGNLSGIVLDIVGGKVEKYQFFNG